MNVADMIKPAPAVNVAKQGDAAWLQQRLGKLTGSRMAVAMSFLKNGQESAERRKLKFDLVAERLTDCLTSRYVTEAMAWGLATEAEAKEAATQLIGIKIKPCGYFDHPEIDNLGATPDGLLDDDGVLEIKCPTTTTHLSWLLANQVPPEYKSQMICQLICTGRRYAQFMSYDPRVPRRPILYKRFAPSQVERDTVTQAAIQFLNEVEELFDRVASTRPSRD